MQLQLPLPPQKLNSPVPLQPLLHPLLHPLLQPLSHPQFVAVISLIEVFLRLGLITLHLMERTGRWLRNYRKFFMWWRSHGTPDKHPAFHSPIPGWDRTDPDFSPLRGSGDSSSRRSIDTGEPADSVPIPSEGHNFLLSRQQRHSFRPAVYNDLWLRDRLHSPRGTKIRFYLQISCITTAGV